MRSVRIFHFCFCFVMLFHGCKQRTAEEQAIDERRRVDKEILAITENFVPNDTHGKSEDNHNGDQQMENVQSGR